MSQENPERGVSRRNLFKIGGGVVAAAVLGSVAYKYLHRSASAQLERLGITLPKALNPLPAPPEDPASKIANLSKLFTPNKDFFIIDNATVVPQVNPSTWKLTIDGMVKNPITLTYKELLARPLIEVDDTIACVSNWVGGPYVGNARWLGVRLDDLINEAKPSKNADQIMSYSVDDFSAGFPTVALDGRDAIIAVGMNGEPLPVRNGFPARLIVPGLYGYVSATKWLSRLELTRFDLKEGFWISRGWAKFAPIKMQSRIDTPNGDQSFPAGKTAIAGVAWAHSVGVEKVEVKINNSPWQETTLGPDLANTTWRQWWIEWDAKPGKHTLSVRAINKNGEIQTEVKKDVLPDGAQGWHTVNVFAQ
jgi:DMSO/TMAO reductase YedYZ molybdopterin-dependent catalytic subunit